jgi:tetrahydromethanopterin S-methyltransferase subunit G
MKIVIILSLLLLASPAFGELTKEDLRTIIKEENAALEKRLKEYIDLKIETMNARIDAVHTRIDALEKSVDGRFDALNMRLDDVDSRFDRIWLAIIALITAAIALPQLIIIYAERKRGREIQTLIQQLHEKNGPPPSPS